MLLFIVSYPNQYILQQKNAGIQIIRDNENEYTAYLKKILEAFSIKYEESKEVNPQNNKIYILIDPDGSSIKLPKYYIVYNTQNYSNLNQKQREIWSKAIIIWDNNSENIKNYNHIHKSNYYFPINYEHADPLILVCFLPVELLNSYQELVIYQNQKNTDISSHLPALFSFAALQKPQITLELGVRGGESTKPLYKSSYLNQGLLIGVDILAEAQNVYSGFSNAQFFHSDDIKFANIFQNNFNTVIDTIFVDTSHEYKHTMEELELYVPLLSDSGFISFHDSNVTPLKPYHYVRLNGTRDGAPGNPRGVTQGIKEFFSIDFDEYHYCNFRFRKNNQTWHLVHYPFCNGLTILKKTPDND